MISREKLSPPSPKDLSPVPKNSFLDQRMSRRGLIKGGAAVVAGGAIVESSAPLIIPALEKMSVIGAIKEQKADWKDANLPDDEFLAKYSDQLKLVTIGTTFSPERAARRYRSYTDEPRSVLKDLKFLVDDVGFKKIRVAYRWSSMVNHEGEFDPTYVVSTLDYLMGSDAALCINTGIKSAGWPEQFPPKFVLQEIGRPENKTVIHDESEMASAFKSFLPTFFGFLKERYRDKLNRIEMFQIENEPFQQFGDYEWTMSYGYLRSLVGEVVKAFPDKRILFNSAGFNDLEMIKDLLVENLATYGMRRFVVGTDFYPLHPDVKDYPVIGRPDPVVIADLLGRYDFGDLKEDAIRYGFDLESTELQGEPWADREMRPGNDVSVLKYNLIRHIKYFSIPGRQSVARWWGGEYLADQVLSGKATSEAKEQHNKEIYIIQRVNSM